ncbi:ABC transporter permease [Paenibacillus roseipurpureus]|uniref:ABC transporter permease subunit n=1 Tax=Paenibacillus roseopurpureus TaxID=2918901 RepID=A0AA96RLR6_9BACL|nr:ABC transporter permease subunit [Paenibacillus sp. MBLB1832]WNR43477.1 ABC transporter permease subunit [Paenibacillus sp. MBLB1832]
MEQATVLGTHVVKTNSKWKIFMKKIRQQRALILIAIPIILYELLFRYFPLWGWIMAFQDYSPGDELMKSEWIGFSNFRELFSNEDFLRVIRNTLAMSLLNLAAGTMSAIMLAVIINETRNVVFKKLVQTISYLPHFVSWVVAANIVITLLSIDNGVFNTILMKLHLIDKPILWLAHEQYFWGIIAASDVWKNVGFGAIIYLATMSAIDPSLYEAASIDGGGRIAKIRYITIPGIMPTIVILLIMHIGGLLNTGFEQQLLLGNALVRNVSEVLDLYVLKYGISMGRYSYSIAAGMFKSVVSIVLILIANRIAKRLGQSRLF